MTDHSELIARLQAGPASLELDEVFARAIGWTTGFLRDNVIGDEIVWRSPLGATKAQAPTFSTSIDAAVTVIPEGWRWTLAQDKDGSFICFLGTSDAQNSDESYLCVEARAQAPSLAICAASLKAIDGAMTQEYRQRPYVTCVTRATGETIFDFTPMHVIAAAVKWMGDLAGMSSAGSQACADRAVKSELRQHEHVIVTARAEGDT